MWHKISTKMLSTRLEEAKVAEVMVPNEVQIVDAPTLPEKAIAPRKVLILLGLCNFRSHPWLPLHIRSILL